MDAKKKDKTTEIVVIYTTITITILLFLWTIRAYGLKPYSEFKADFKKEIFDFFPTLNVLKNYHIYSNSTTTYDLLGYSDIVLIYKYNKRNFEKELNSINKKAIFHYNDKECLLLLFDEKARLNCDTNLILCPIYDIYNNKYKNTDYEPSDNLEYYIFEFKEGWYFKNDELLKVDVSESKFRKYTYKHGYSSGAVVDRKQLIIFYWVMVW
jgi:hypothetical protein